MIPLWKHSILKADLTFPKINVKNCNADLHKNEGQIPCSTATRKYSGLL